VQHEHQQQQVAEDSLISHHGVPAVVGTRENLAAYGQFISNEVHNPGLSIPFYKGSVIEGGNFEFICNGAPTARTAQVKRKKRQGCLLICFFFGVLFSLHR